MALVNTELGWVRGDIVRGDRAVVISVGGAPRYVVGTGRAD